MTSTNPTEAEEDLLTEDGGTHDAQSTHELPETQQPTGTDEVDQGRLTFAVNEKESESSTHEPEPSSPLSSSSEQHVIEAFRCNPEDVKQTLSEIFDHEGRRDCEAEEMMPAVVITRAEEVSSEQVEDVFFSVSHTDCSGTASPSDGTELSGSDLLSLKSDTLSLISETNISCKSDVEDDTRSVTASSVLSLFPRVQMEPIERDWLRCAALGNATTLYLLLQQDPTLVSRKTALHWAAKQGRVETVDMMARRGADINQRAGYTPLHLASIHGHEQVLQLLINIYNAKVNIRDYHGKMAAHYWNGSKDVFAEHRAQSAGSWPRGRRSQSYMQLSVLLSRSQSNRNISAETDGCPLNHSPSS
ncbi:ankyrin repeat domain-containing protein SOWAHC [Danio aesculapii]|uniref:ankyrin repeat domain-containing protein SOWAHC n=1 Tax=Danio aesculapii TaxID=1142201 RepID=UPI0024C092A2|nr:ankyrin repeat domain-containing protein SOWAHC [Danio aesculapii]